MDPSRVVSIQATRVSNILFLYGKCELSNCDIGPCAVYMKAVSDATKSPGYGAGWFKIWEDGYRDGKFCAQRIIDNNGRMTVKIPNDLRGGDYLIRAEQLALHQAQILGGAQWYIG